MTTDEYHEIHLPCGTTICGPEGVDTARALRHHQRTCVECLRRAGAAANMFPAEQ